MGYLKIWSKSGKPRHQRHPFAPNQPKAGSEAGALRVGAERAIALCLGQEGFDPDSSASDARWLHEMASVWQYGRPKRTMGAQRRKRHVTVVGAASCIGAPLCHALASQGHHVCAVDSFHDGTKRLELEATGATCVRYDLASYHDGDAAGLPEADLVYFCLWQPFHDLSEASPPQMIAYVDVWV